MASQPLKIPIVQKPSPVIGDQLVVEQEDSNSAPFDRMLELGHLHGDQVKYPNHRLLKQGPNAFGVYQRVWGTSPILEDSYNAELEFSAEANAFPIYARAYRVLRSDYLVTGPLTKGTAFTGLIAVKVTAGGSGYPADFAVTFTGGGGSGATGLAIVDGRGAVVRIELTALGSGYTSAPTPALAGSGATATAVLNGSGVASVTVAPNANFLYDGPTIVSFNGIPTGFGAAGTPVFTPTGVNSVFVENGGSGYTAATATITGGGGSGATATVNLVGDAVDSITVNTPGSGYTTPPTVTISGDGTGALARVRLLTSIASVTLASAGSAYITPAIVAFSQGPATATTTLITTSFSVASINVTAAGTGYSAVLVGFSGGGGSGAAATATLSGGAVSSIAVTSAGSAYTSVPAVAITNSGSGATATAAIQPAAAVLVIEKHSKLPEDDPYALLFDRVLRVYETLPGPELVRLGFEPETGAAMKTYSQRVAIGTSARALSGSLYNSQYVVDSYVDPIDSVVGNLITVTMVMPSAHSERKSVGFQFPAEFTFIGGWTIPPICTIGGPYPGVTHDLTQHRTASKPATLNYSYSLGEPSVANTWTVTSPGSADRFFGIQANTIHNAISITETCGAGSQLLEDLPASTPSSYSPTDVLLIQASATKWKGNIFRKTLVTTSES